MTCVPVYSPLEPPETGQPQPYARFSCCPSAHPGQLIPGLSSYGSAGGWRGRGRGPGGCPDIPGLTTPSWGSQGLPRPSSVVTTAKQHGQSHRTFLKFRKFNIDVSYNLPPPQCLRSVLYKCCFAGTGSHTTSGPVPMAPAIGSCPSAFLFPIHRPHFCSVQGFLPVRLTYTFLV